MNRIAIVLILAIAVIAGRTGNRPASAAMEQTSSEFTSDRIATGSVMPSATDGMVVSTTTIDLKTADPDSVQVDLIGHACRYSDSVPCAAWRGEPRRLAAGKLTDPPN